VASGPSVLVKFLADTSKMTGDVDKASTSMTSSIGSFAKKAALSLGAAFAAKEVIDFGKASVEAAAADAEAQAKLAQALKTTAGATDAQVAGAESFISKLSQQAAIADDDLRPALATLARGFKDTGKAQDALTLATDVAAGTGKDLSTVTEAMMKAANGNTGALGRLGVATKDAAGNSLSLDQIMANMAETFKGQASAAADSTAGRMRAAKIAFGEFQEQIGSALLPVITTLATLFTGTLMPAMSATFGWITDHKDIVLAVLAGIAAGFVALGITLIPVFIAWVAGAAAAAAATIVAAAPFIAIGAVIAGVAYLIIHNWDTIVAATTATWDAIIGAVQFVWNWIKANWPTLLAVITGPFGLAVKLIVDNWDTIKGAAQAVWNWLNGTWQSLTGIITAPISAAASAISGFFGTIKDAATGAYNWVKDKFDSIAGAIDSVIGGIRTAVTSVVNAIKAPINAVIGAWNGLEFRVPSVTIPSVSIPGLGTIGGGSFGGQVIGFPDLPKLAAGGVLTSPTLFLGGEGGQTEIVAPEALLRAIVAEESGGHYTLNLYPRTADASDIAYGFRRLELMAGLR
jgi:hypothetical protein